MEDAWPAAEDLLTERLELWPLREAHAEAMVHVLAEPNLYQHTGGEPPTLEELTARYQRQERGVSPNGTSGWLNWIVVERGSGDFAGYVQATVTRRTDDTLAADLAWVVGSAFQGRGYASEAARAVADWLREAGVAELSAYIGPVNLPSQAIARKLGMSPSGTRDDGEVRWA